MHQRALESDIIIVNHHLFFADLSLQGRRTTRAASCPSITPWCSTKRTRSKTSSGQYFGVSVSNYRFQDLRRDIAVIGRMKKFGTPELDRILQRLDELAAQFFELFGEADRRVAFTGRDAFREDNEEIYTDLLAALDLIGSHLKLMQNPPEEIIPLFRRTQRAERRRCAS